MKPSEQLIGGTSASRRVRRISRPAESAPPQVGYRFLAIVVLVAGAFVFLGAWKVDRSFRIADLEMESRRLQDVTQQRHDRYKVLLSREAALQRGDVLKAAAQDSLGLAEPAPESMQTLLVPAESVTRWQQGAGRIDTEANGKEDPTSTKGS